MTTEQKTEYKNNYPPHDLLQDYLIDRFSMIGLETEQFGYDGGRGVDDAAYAYGPDMKVYADGEIVAYIEIKSKRLDANGDDWYARLDKAHWEQYMYGHDFGFDGAKGEDVPVVIYFGVVDEDNGVIVRDGFIPVESEEQVQDGFRLGGDIVVTLDKDDERNIHWLLYELGI